MEHLRKVVPQQLLINNHDGLLDVPAALRDKNMKRSLKMVTLTKEQRLQAELVLLQDRAQRTADKEKQLLKEIEKQKAKDAMIARGLSEREMYLEEAKTEVFETLKRQA
jgi:hypothetical protein